ncbi:MAG: hypothetical protein CL693_03995 [Cellvibrionaceae bacterium]|nr:hypothetical protein [Cellvibrionaceae bacterium]|tara:strand:- start:766 stop:2070 length:1305 start_codon:yes stop_codon:yes gene_type:complete
MDFFAGFPALTITLFILIGLMTVWFAGPGYNSHSASHSPTILTSTGIFGTFLGVALGLLTFDTANIQDSVPGLISGLKTAFWTSIAGLLGSLVVKFRHLTAVLKQRQVEEQYSAATVTDLANLLGDIRDSMSNAEAGGLRASLETMQARQEDKLESLQLALKSYQSDMVEANTRSFINAIEQVMRDFNTQINAQYGDNFKQLNEAVGQMLIWQDTYKKELEELLATQRSNGDLLDKASAAYEKMVRHSEIFTQVSNSLGKMLDVLQQQAEGMDQYIEQLAKVAGQASKDLPALEKRVYSLTEGLATSIQDSQLKVSQTVEASAESLRLTSESVNQTLAQVMEQQQNGLLEQVERMVTRTENQVTRLDDAMEDELTKALKTFGYQLTSLSEKFVSDYVPLTDKLSELITMIESVPSPSSKLGASDNGRTPRVSAQ